MLSQKKLLDNYDEALGAFRERLRISPRDPDLHTRVGLVLFHQGRLAEAVEEFRKEIQNRTATVMTYLMLGHALRDLRMLPEASAPTRKRSASALKRKRAPSSRAPGTGSPRPTRSWATARGAEGAGGLPEMEDQG